MKQPLLQKGSLLLLSLLATASILAGVFAVSTILVREVRVSADIDNATLAFYGLEGAIEQGLHGLRKLDLSPGALSGGGTLDNGVQWSLQASSTKMELIIDSIKKNASEVITLYNNDNLPNKEAGVESISIEWKSGSNLRLTIREWNGSTLSSLSTQTLACGAIPCQTIINNTLIFGRAYELTVEALGDDIIEMKVLAWTGDGATGVNVPIPIPITIEAIASIGASKQAQAAAIPQKLPWQ